MPSSRRPAYRWQPDSGFIYAGLSSSQVTEEETLLPISQTFDVYRTYLRRDNYSPSVITKTGLDIHRYICGAGLWPRWRPTTAPPTDASWRPAGQGRSCC